MRIVVYEQRGSARQKIAGVERYGQGIVIGRIVSLDVSLPDFIEEPAEYLADDIDADLVLNYLRHPDLSQYLVELCSRRGVAVLAPGKHHAGALCPFTCCSQAAHPDLGGYGQRFGLPQLEVTLDGQGRIASVVVLRGAPCGATWEAAAAVIGLTPEEALTRLPLTVQFCCGAKSDGFDPVSGKSPVHQAGHVHHAALARALRR
ncbi:MAG: hypothetical protein BWK76_03750 [Desulfobulbaceae bacterium A2]|nr:MAG: hypothetical protein BWK76_03750 [Desulfobulbaceae bacterium A2]